MSDVKNSLPSSWIEVELNDLAVINYGKALAAGIRSAGGRIPVIGSSGKVGYHNEALVDGPCLVVGRKGAAGSVHLVPESSWPIDTAYFIQPPKDIDLVFLSYLLGTCGLGALDKSTAIPSLSRDDLYRVLVPVAPRAEQARIVAKLEELLSDLDAGVAELKAAQKKLAQYRQSLLKAAVEGALTAAWRTQHQPTETGAQLLQRILQERRARWEARQLAKFAEQGKTPPKDWQKKYPEPVQPDTTGLPELPQGWVWASLDQLALDSSYGTSVKCGYESQGASVLRIPNVIARKLVLDDLKFASQPLDLHKSEYLAPGDILVVRTNGSVSLVGRAAEVTEPLPGDFYFASYLLRVRCLETSVVHRWVSALLASRQGRSWIESRAASSAGQHNLSLSTLLTIPIPLPPIVEQAEAMNALEAVLLSVSEQEQFLDKSLQQSTAQRQNILRAAFSGQLVAQDPHDEPASVLLERIRAERAAQGAVKKPRGRKAKEAA